MRVERLPTAALAELCSIHPSAECEPLQYASIWNDADVDALRLMTDLVHREGSLAGCELYHGGVQHSNLLARVPPFAPSDSRFTQLDDPVQSFAMDKADIRNLIRWQADAARRCVKAGFDIVYVYAGHGMVPLQFLLRKFNARADEYGGSVRNRARLLQEMIQVS